MIRQTNIDSRNRARRLAQVCTVVGMLATLGGCALPGIGTGPATTQTIGDPRLADAHAARYAFGRARVAVSIEGTSTRRPAAADKAAFTQTVKLTIGPTKYATDGTLATRVAETPADRFKVTIDEQRLLKAVVAVTDGNIMPVPPGNGGIAAFGAELERTLPAGPRVVTITRTSPAELKAFRHDTEIDPAVPAELETLQGDLDRVARGWGLKATFASVTVDATVGNERVRLAANREAHCNEPVCFRLPIPYRLALAPSGSGWKGKLETHVWLPNDGPIGAIDVRNPLFAATSARATFENGMLLSLTASDPKAAAMLLRLPLVATASAARR